MKRLQELTQEINEITLKMEQDYPELYKYLDENPVTIPCCEHPKLDTKSFSDYLESLKQLLNDYVKNHQNKI